MEMRPHRRIILPLDVSTQLEAIDLASDLHEHVGVLKVGSRLFTAVGPDVLAIGPELGLDIFLDLKLYDMPNTVAEAVRAAAEHKVRFLTVHASGGHSMLRAAAAAAPPEMTILAVTVLTSLTSHDLRAMNIDGTSVCSDDELPRIQAKYLARIAWESGVRGFVCSPFEVKALRDELGPDAVFVVSGVRPADADVQDQARAATPKDAMEAGADYLVIGRSITQAKDRVKAARSIAEEIRPFT